MTNSPSLSIDRMRTAKIPQIVAITRAVCISCPIMVVASPSPFCLRPRVPRKSGIIVLGASPSRALTHETSRRSGASARGRAPDRAQAHTSCLEAGRQATRHTGAPGTTRPTTPRQAPRQGTGRSAQAPPQLPQVRVGRGPSWAGQASHVTLHHHASPCVTALPERDASCVMPRGVGRQGTGTHVNSLSVSVSRLTSAPLCATHAPLLCYAGYTVLLHARLLRCSVPPCATRPCHAGPPAIRPL